MISILLGTRNRPEKLKRFLQSIKDTTTNLGEVEVCPYVDDDDVLTPPVLEEMAAVVPINAFVGPRIPLNQICNSVYHYTNGPIYMGVGDDVIFRTPGWDVKVEELYAKSEDKILMVYGSDGFQNERVATHPFVHKHWIEILGYLVPPYFAVAYSDNWVTDLAEMVGRRVYVPELVFEHMHPVAGKAEWDASYKKVEIYGDEKTLYQTLAPKREEDANKLRAFINLCSNKYQKQ